MNNFKLNHEERFGEGGGIKDGTYEVIIRSVREDASNSGTLFINIPLTIRNDIKQSHQNAIIWHKIWKSKETGQYNIRALNTIGWATRLDADKEYGSLNDLFEELQGKVARVTVKNESSEYNGKVYENVNVKNWNESQYPISQHKWKHDDKPTVVELTDDDLPF